jgi:hypothetical protein
MFHVPAHKNIKHPPAQFLLDSVELESVERRFVHNQRTEKRKLRAIGLRIRSLLRTYNRFTE